MFELSLSFGWYLWMELTFGTPPQGCRIDCSWESDTPLELTRALLMLANAEGHVDVQCSDDRRVFDIRFRRLGDRLLATVKREPKVRFRGEGHFIEMASRFVIQMRRLVAEAGSERGYKEKWGHPFPSAELNRLESTLGR